MEYYEMSEWKEMTVEQIQKKYDQYWKPHPIDGTLPENPYDNRDLRGLWENQKWIVGEVYKSHPELNNQLTNKKEKN